MCPEAAPGAPSGSRDQDEAVRLLGIRESALSVDEVIAAVSDRAAGGIVVFIGTVRDNDAPADGTSAKPVTQLGYSAHPTAHDVLRDVARRVVARHPVRALAAVHRVGDLEVGDLAVVVAVASAHRGEAFTAARELIDDLKSEVPVWKFQRFADGSDEWVGSP